MESIFIYIYVLLIGACIGSFLNVAALRAISGESIIFPPSKCPSCGAHIKWYDNIPVLSYLFTFKGKCRNCRTHVSLQYPIVEALTAIAFLAAYAAYGFSVKTLLLLILFCVSMVITITDIKKEYVFDIHSWILIVFAVITSLYLNGIENYIETVLGLIAGAVTMEAAAKLSYYLIRKRNTVMQPSEENKAETSVNTAEAGSEASNEHKCADIDDEDFDINEYINEKKRAFGEGDTYLAAAAGALLGWKYLLLSIFIAVLVQALCVLPGFITNLYKRKQYELLISLSMFFVIAALYQIISNVTDMHLYIILAFAACLVFCAANTINRLKETASIQGFYTIPFGPAILISAGAVFFFGRDIFIFLTDHVFTI